MKKLLIILTILLTLCGCEDYNELNNLSIVTAVAIDKQEKNYKVTVLIANSPKVESTSKEGEATTTVYSGTGKSIASAIKVIDKKAPKQLYFSHVNVVVISEDVGKEGFLKIADWLIRHPQTKNKFYLLQVNDNKAGDVLKIISPLESFPSQSIATLIESSKNPKSTGDTASYNNFIGRILETGYEPIMQVIKINGSVKKGSKQTNIETSQPSTYLSIGPVAIYKKDKLVKTTTDKQTECIQIINNEIKQLVKEVKYKDNNMNIFSNDIKTKIKLTSNNSAVINVTGTGNIYEINGNINLTNQKNIQKLEKAWNTKTKKDLENLIHAIKYEYKSDIFGFGNLIYKNYPQRWKKIKNEWNDTHFKDLKITIKTNLKITSTGDLTKTLKDGES